MHTLCGILLFTVVLVYTSYKTLITKFNKVHGMKGLPNCLQQCMREREREGEMRGSGGDTER